MTIPYRSLKYTPKDQGGMDLGFSDLKIVEQHTWLEFSRGVSWTPQRMEINGRKGRRAACVVAEDSFHYRVYDLDARDRAHGIERGMSETNE